VTARLTRAERREQTRRALLDAAGRVFVDRGFAGASVEAIAAEAGYTRGAFYSNFATKEELFAALLQDRVYAGYRRMAERRLDDPGHMPSGRETGEELARIQADPEGHWLFRLWLELLAHAGRDEAFKGLAAGFWSGNRALVAEVARQRWGDDQPADPQLVATISIALDVGLALQHFVDPGAVGLDAWPDAFGLFAELLERRPG
jgi:AcrR family transcriptional regulator